MKKLIAALNEKGIFHTITDKGVEILAAPASLDADGKAQLMKYFGFGEKDFTVPDKMKDPFVNKASDLIKSQASQASSKANSKKEQVKKGY